MIIPVANAPELTEIPGYITAKLSVRPVRTMQEVLEIALARPLGNKDTPEKAERGRAIPQGLVPAGMA